MTPENLNLADLTTVQGFTITGTSSDQTGNSVKDAGDVNGDGYNDIIIGSPGGSSGSACVIYGNNTGFPLTISVSNVFPPYGFSITGTGSGFGYAVSGAGDVNNDGFDDVIIGTNGGSYCAYVIFGNSSHPSPISIASLGNYGFSIQNTGQGCYQESVSGLGDINGDTYDDMIIGSPTTHSNTGQAYIVYGKSSFPSSIDLADTGELGVFTTINGASNSNTGQSVSNAGDVNNDGYMDAIIGSNAYAFIIYGNASLPLSITISAAGELGIFTTIENSGVSTGNSVSWAGDINQDGYDDVIIGEPNINIVYVVYGNASLAITINLLKLGTQGFNITGSSGSFGASVSGVGDVNKDGYLDLMIGAPEANSNAGESWVVYGNGSSSSSINIVNLGTQGFSITGGNSYNGKSVSGAGDFNKDGYNDILVGAPGNAGDAYLIYGAASGFMTSFPTGQPSSHPTHHPSVQPTSQPTDQPSGQPTTYPSGQPSSQPSSQPSLQPSAQPSSQPSSQPSGLPSQSPSSSPTDTSATTSKTSINIVPMAVGIIGGIVFVGTVYCIYAKIKHWWPFNSAVTSADNIIEVTTSPVYAGDAGIGNPMADDI